MPPTRSPTTRATLALRPGARPAVRAPAPPPAPAKHELVLFVSSVEGKPVSRLPLPGSRGRSLIGARREGGQYIYDIGEIVGLTRAEVELHGMVYARLVAEGELRRRTRADWQAWQLALREREKMAAEEAKNAPAPPAEGDRS